MPNRILKEGICRSDDVNQLTWFEEVLFYRLIVNCDDFGRFDGREIIIKNALFPLKDNLTVKTVHEAINKLASIGLVVLYEYEGRPYLYLPTWYDHQASRATKSKYPDPENGEKTSACNCNQTKTSACNCNQTKTSACNCNQTKTSENKCPRIRNTYSYSYSDARSAKFSQFWKLYPKKVNKKKAFDAWNKLDVTDELFSTIMTKLNALVQTPEWTKNGGQFVPHPSTWLNGRRWEDEIDQPEQPKPKPFVIGDDGHAHYV